MFEFDLSMENIFLIGIVFIVLWASALLHSGNGSKKKHSSKSMLSELEIYTPPRRLLPLPKLEEAAPVEDIALIDSEVKLRLEPEFTENIKYHARQDVRNTDFQPIELEKTSAKKKRRTQLKKAASQAEAYGIVFGKYKKRSLVYSPAEKEGSICVFGGSGLGKTSALLIPTLRSWVKTANTCFVIDISGDISKNVPAKNKLIVNPDDKFSIPYNIFGNIDKLQDDDDIDEALEQLALHIMPESYNMSDTSLFFIREGRKILIASLMAFYRQGLDFTEICEKIMLSSWKSLFQSIDESGYKRASSYINSFEGASEQNTAGCKQSCDGAIRLFATNKNVRNMLRRPHEGEISFTPEILEHCNVFVCIEDVKLELYAPLLHIITATSLEYFSGRSNDSTTTILFCLDEFVSLGKLDITPALRKLRKKHVRLMILTQSMADIDLVYGTAERMAMMNNFRFKVILGASDTDTQEYFAKLIGYMPVKKYSISRNTIQTTTTESESKEYVTEPADLDRLGDDLILLHPDGYIKLKKNFYFEKN